MKFLVLAVVEARESRILVDFIERLKDELRTALRDVYFTALKDTGELPEEFYAPCPRDGALTRLENVGGRFQEVYQGVCGNGHKLLVDTTE